MDILPEWPEEFMRRTGIVNERTHNIPGEG